MNRRFLLTFSLLSCGLLAAAAGCGDDTGSGGSGGGTTTTGTGTGNTTATGTTKSGSTSTSSMNTTSTGGMAATCAAYCAGIDAACGEPLKQYPSTAACEEVCLSFAQGDMGDMAMDTLECRAYHTGAAAGTPDPHCVHAGPLGGGVDAGDGCGTDRCAAFCNAATQVCDGNNSQWGTVADCMTDCAMMPDDVDYSTSTMGGDSLTCRMYHMTVAANAKVTNDMQGFADHCTHIALDSGPCGG